MERDPEVAAPQVGGDVARGIDDGADHQLDDAEVLCLAVSSNLSGCFRALDQLCCERVESLADLNGSSWRLGDAKQKFLQTTVDGLLFERALVEPHDRVPWIRIGDRLLQ